MLPILIGAVSAAGSLVGDITEQNAAKKAKEDEINAYKKLLIPSSETELRADRAGDTLYTKTMGELNSGAFAARGALNPETLKTIAYTKMVGARATTEQGIYDQDFGYNKQVQQKIAGAEATPIPAINPFNAVESGIQGYMAGTQLQMGLDMNAQYASLAQAQANYYNRQGGVTESPANSPVGNTTKSNAKFNPSWSQYFNPDNFTKPQTGYVGALPPVEVTGERYTPPQSKAKLNFGMDMSPVDTPQKYGYDGSVTMGSESGPLELVNYKNRKKLLSKSIYGLGK